MQPHDKELDASGLACPMPIVKTKKALEGLAPGQVLRVRCYNEFSRSGPLMMLAIGFAFITVRLEVVPPR